MADKVKLGQILVKSGAISLKDLESFLKSQEELKDERGYQTKLGDLLLEHKLVTEATLAMAFAEQQGVRFIDLSNFSPDLNILEKIPFSILSRFKFVPIFIDSQKLTVALHDPVDTFLLDLLYKALGITIEIQSATRSHIENAHKACLDTVKKAGRENLDFDINFEEYRQILEQEKEIKPEVEKPEVSLKNNLSDLALEQILKNCFYTNKYSLIKFVPNRLEVNVMCKNRDLNEYFGSLSHEAFHTLFLKIRNLCHLPNDDIHYITQGWLEVILDKEDKQTLVVTFIPTYFGLEIQIEPYTLDKRSINVDKLSLLETDVMRILNFGSDPRGILITGGPQAGKSTSLLALMNQPRHTNQSSLLFEEKASFSSFNRSHIALDSEHSLLDGLGYLSATANDVIGIDPLRIERMSTVFRQISGKTLYTTHEAPAIIPFLAHIEKQGIGLGLILSSFRMIIHQKLIPAICPWCSTLTPYPADHIAQMGLKPETLKKPLFYYAAGCEYCENTGSLDYTLAYEILHITSTTIKLLTENNISNDLAIHLMKSGALSSINSVAKDKLYRGIISLDTYVALMQRKI